MTFNQWAANCNLDSSLRLAFEAVWDGLVSGQRTSHEAGSLLIDLLQALSETSEYDSD